ncbi:hypothetical protein [Chelativorans intermedius]|uniref:Uncharacterized protein n=1 Tax=Chelativorans intermedius TaxID=515947 RepID=A0ABV6DAB1_9HYPH|nr:hypothetical protein [Chelativorans intermedius]MCT8998615.1 hypothetical protein [Chelativorans intermedius]
MKTAASTIIQILALAACLSVQASGGEFKMAGVRRAIQTIAAAGPSTQIAPPAGTMAADDGIDVSA